LKYLAAGRIPFVFTDEVPAKDEATMQGNNKPKHDFFESFHLIAYRIGQKLESIAGCRLD
jgi:hypothetical protein